MLETGERAIQASAALMTTIEVRRSNQAALDLYQASSDYRAVGVAADLLAGRGRTRS